MDAAEVVWFIVRCVSFGVGGYFAGRFGARLVFHIIDRKAMSKKNRKKHDPLNYYSNRAESDAAKAAADNKWLLPSHPLNGGYRGGTQAHRTGTPGSASNGSGYGAGAIRAGSRLGPSMDEFSGIEKVYEAPTVEEVGLALGVVRGARSFLIDSMGRLTGVVYKQVWTPGENLATCRMSDNTLTISFNKLSHVIPLAGNPGTYLIPNPSEPHTLTDCKHGFYAYYDGSDDYHKPGMVSAVVEGYGETVIGTRGFRSMKARIVALHIPDDVKPYLRRLVTRNYPEVPVFDTFEQMVSEVPPDSAGNEPSPDSDPDFWSRPA